MQILLYIANLSASWLHRRPRCCFGLRRIYLFWAILLILLVGAVLTALLPPAEDHRGVGVLDVLRRATPRRQNPAQVHRADSSEEEEKFIIIIQTFNRTDILLKLLNHYQGVPHLQRIIIVWNNIGEQTPAKLWNSLGPHPVQVVFKEQTSNRMRNRLQPFPEVDTNGQYISLHSLYYLLHLCVFSQVWCLYFIFYGPVAVLMLDDDTLISVPDITFAFSVWKVTSLNLIPSHTHISRQAISCFIFGSTAISRPDCWLCPEETCLKTRSVQLWQFWAAGPRNNWRWQVGFFSPQFCPACYWGLYYKTSSINPACLLLGWLRLVIRQTGDLYLC